MIILDRTNVTNQSRTRPQTASLDDPLYYLENTLTVVNWVRDYHGDLLTDAEKARLSQFLALPRPSQALLMRLLMRSRNLFRVDTLEYAELGQPISEALAPLFLNGWIDPEPRLAVGEVCDLLRRQELATVFARELNNTGLKSSATKGLMQAVLLESFPQEHKPLADWWPTGGDQVIRLQEMALFDRLRLMFFGNLRQDWNEFVITELGHQRYESVPFSPGSRAFHGREDVDQYLALHAYRELLDEAMTAEACRSLWDQLPPDGGTNPWLRHRRARLLFALGQKLERAGELTLARDTYREAWIPDARVRYFRLLEKMAPATEVWPFIEEAEALAETASEKQSLSRILHRVGKKVGVSARPTLPADPLPLQTIIIPLARELSVEHQVAMVLADKGGHCFYVENTLFTGLFGLLFWPAIFAPHPGAFFHPFQTGPADLYREDFTAQRQELIEEALTSLEQGDYRERIRHRWQTRQGITNPFVHWPVFTEGLITLALDLIPASHLKAVFTRLLADIRVHRSGLPDLIRFLPEEGTYELIEVKAPGDRLQDNQRLWMAFFAETGIPASVCHVLWDANP